MLIIACTTAGKQAVRQLGPLLYQRQTHGKARAGMGAERHPPTCALLILCTRGHIALAIMSAVACASNAKQQACVHRSSAAAPSHQARCAATTAPPPVGASKPVSTKRPGVRPPADNTQAGMAEVRDRELWVSGAGLRAARLSASYSHLRHPCRWTR